MDIRVVESMMTGGALADAYYRINPELENVSLDFDESDGSLSVVDYNLNYNYLPWQLGTDLVKKVFLTYNGHSCETNQLLETVVLESGNSAEPTGAQLPGYNDSNEWKFSPATWTLPSSLASMTDPNNYLTHPYDVSQGYTIVKESLTSEGNVIPGGSYTVFNRHPHLTRYQAANVESNKVYTDGWYTSYVMACKKWSLVDPVANGSFTGQILYYAPQDKFYINLTGAGGSLITDPNNIALFIPDTTNWRESPTFSEWQAFLKQNLGSAQVGDPIYFIETQHLVTVELNKAILVELKEICNCCTEPLFGQSHMEDWMKLTHKRLGAWQNFNLELFNKAQKIVESSRGLCYICLYDRKCLEKNKSC